MKSPRVIRALNLPSSTCWLIYNSIYFSVAGLMNEILVITSIIIAEVRLYHKQKKSEVEKVK